MNTVKQVIMKRDGLTSEEADDCIEDFRRDLNELLSSPNGGLEDAYDLVENHFGLEPDYLEEFLF